MSDSTRPVGIFNVTTTERADRVGDLLEGITEDVYVGGRWLEVLLSELRFALKQWHDRCDATTWRAFLAEHPELLPDSEGPAEIGGDNVLDALRAAVADSKVGAVTTFRVGEVLWSEEVPLRHGPELGYRATRAQLRLAQVLLRLSREGKIDRLRAPRTPNYWTLAGHPIHDGAFVGFQRDEA